MAYDYDALYQSTPDALGAPTQAFVDFFDQFTPNDQRVLDVGCGQGRDALFIARKGHRVVAVDFSPSGIADLIAAARKDDLPIEGIVADIVAFQPDGIFDVIVVDRTLHMLDETPRLEVLRRLAAHVAAHGWILIADEAANMAAFRDVLSNDTHHWREDKRGRVYLFAQQDGLRATA